jgi:hypothetical protein
MNRRSIPIPLFLAHHWQHARMRKCPQSLSQELGPDFGQARRMRNGQDTPGQFTIMNLRISLVLVFMRTEIGAGNILEVFPSALRTRDETSRSHRFKKEDVCMKFIIIIASVITITFGAIELWFGLTGLFGSHNYAAMLKGAAAIANASVLLALYLNRERRNAC